MKEGVRVSMNKKGISLLVLIITIIVVLIISSSIVMNINNQELSESTKLATLQSDMQYMLDQYEVIYNELLIKYNGDISKIDESELQDSIPDKYKSTYVATISGINYIGDNEEERKIAENMGIYILDN